MKKVISIILCAAIIISTFAIAGATSAFATEEVESMSDVAELAQNNNGSYTPVVFIPGIGQSETYAYKEDGSIDSHWNLIGVNTDFDAKDIVTLAKAAVPLVLTLLVGKNLVSQESLNDLMKVLLKNCVLDENGNPPANVKTPNFQTSVANYEEMYGEAGKTGKEIFLKRIPCQDLIDEIGAENVFCYNYSAFSYTYKEASGLNDFIKNVVQKETGAEKVILIPMSMGATVVSAYLSEYAAEDDVEKVISIVGAWNGSDVFADLLMLDYDEDAPEMLYNGVIAELVGEPYGNLVNIALRLFPKPVLREFIDEALSALIKELICKTTSFFSLVPYERYDEVAKKWLSGDDMKAIKAETDKYHKAQGELKNTLYNCRDKYGVEFYFICGYNMEFGQETSDFLFFQFFATSDTTNSDEIIQISSTGVGVTYAPAGKKLAVDYVAKNPVCTDKNHNHISPDGSIDVSTSYFPETTWCFESQTHELTWNDTALELCYAIVYNEIKSVNDSADFPQFNESRDVKKLVRDYIPAAKAILAGENEDVTLTSAQTEKLTKALADAEAMVERTINDRDEDDKIIKALYDCLVEVGYYNAPSEPSVLDNVLDFILNALNTVVDAIVGPRGFSDLFKEIIAAIKK